MLKRLLQFLAILTCPAWFPVYFVLYTIYSGIINLLMILVMSITWVITGVEGGRASWIYRLHLKLLFREHEEVSSSMGIFKDMWYDYHLTAPLLPQDKYPEKK